jgi:hypothetical protein
VPLRQEIQAAALMPLREELAPPFEEPKREFVGRSIRRLVGIKMDRSKLTSGMAERVAHAGGGVRLDVIVELQPFTLPDSGTREARIAWLRTRFDEEARPVLAAIHAAGGEVLGTAWINHTLRARLPVESVTALAELPEVFRIDVPRALLMEADN